MRERDHLDDPVVDGRIILRWIFRKWDVCRIIIKYLKVFKIVPTCFGSKGIHHQGALYSAWLKLQ